MDEKPVKQYLNLEYAYQFYNKSLFNSSLPYCLITFQRQHSTYGYVSYKRFNNKYAKDEHIDEIALNPDFFFENEKKILSTLVHEMVHLWQHYYGKESRAGYHNKEWACKMQEAGLMPSHNGKPGGNKTGQQMDDYIITDGIFDRLSNDLLKDHVVIYESRNSELEAFINYQVTTNNIPREEIKIDSIEQVRAFRDEIKPQLVNNKNKIKYTCPQCKVNVWGKPDLNILCGDCGIQMIEVHMGRGGSLI